MTKKKMIMWILSITMYLALKTAGVRGFILISGQERIYKQFSEHMQLTMATYQAAGTDHHGAKLA